MYRIKGFREKVVCVIVSPHFSFSYMFADQLLVVDEFSYLYFLTRAKKQRWHGKEIVNELEIVNEP